MFGVGLNNQIQTNKNQTTKKHVEMIEQQLINQS